MWKKNMALFPFTYSLRLNRASILEYSWSHLRNLMDREKRVSAHTHASIRSGQLVPMCHLHCKRDRSPWLGLPSSGIYLLWKWLAHEIICLTMGSANAPQSMQKWKWDFCVQAGRFRLHRLWKKHATGCLLPFLFSTMKDAKEVCSRTSVQSP